MPIWGIGRNNWKWSTTPACVTTSKFWVRRNTIPILKMQNGFTMRMTVSSIILRSPILAAPARNIVAAAAHNSLTYIERALTSALGNNFRSTQIDDYLQRLATADLACTETEQRGTKNFGAGPRTIRAAALYWIAQRQTRAVQQELTDAKGLSRKELAAEEGKAEQKLAGARALAKTALKSYVDECRRRSRRRGTRV